MYPIGSYNCLEVFTQDLRHEIRHLPARRNRKGFNEVVTMVSEDGDLSVRILKGFGGPTSIRVSRAVEGHNNNVTELLINRQYGTRITTIGQLSVSGRVPGLRHGLHVPSPAEIPAISQIEIDAGLALLPVISEPLEVRS